MRFFRSLKSLESVNISVLPPFCECSDWARPIATLTAVTILGPLAGEPPEPMTKEQFEAARKRLRATLNRIVSIDKPELERLIAEVIWLKRRLHRVEGCDHAAGRLSDQAAA